ncbi:MAG: DinB family protein [Phycisphaerae bacterium]|nr:DinB family protein [Phycisphaerae bacterium]
MTPTQLLLNQLGTSTWLIEQAVKDLSDADARYQPAPGLNHAVWILMHLASTEDGMLSKLAGRKSEFPADLAARYGGGTSPDPKDTMTRDQALRHFTETRQRTMRIVPEISAGDWDKPAPAGFPPMFKTVGECLGLLPTHSFWHFGQLLVNRRMLNKPTILGPG